MSLFCVVRWKDPVFDFVVLKIEKPVPFSDCPQNAAGVAHGDHIVRQIVRDQASRADNGIVADTDAGQNNDACPNQQFLPI